MFFNVQTFSFWYFQHPVFMVNKAKSAIKQAHNVKSFLIKKHGQYYHLAYVWPHFSPFLAIFSTFHQNFLQLCKKPPSYISVTHHFLFPMVNNGPKFCQKLWTFFSPLLILQGECEVVFIIFTMKLNSSSIFVLQLSWS